MLTVDLDAAGIEQRLAIVAGHLAASVPIPSWTSATCAGVRRCAGRCAASGRSS